MKRLVLDDSACMPWLFEDGHLPSTWPLEAGNVVCRAERAGSCLEIEAASSSPCSAIVAIEIDAITATFAFTETLSLARRFYLFTYDAAYLAGDNTSRLPRSAKRLEMRHASAK